jgi:mannose/cellobiose epimerase-like protein (N-acyl-D-glucosamine 2-epimerase family)
MRAYDAAFARAHVLERILPFWARHATDREHGGFLTCLTRRGEVYDSTKSAAMNGRMAYAFARGHELDPHSGHLDLARHAADFLVERMWDHTHGGWYETADREGVTLDAAKGLFTQAYVLFGLAHYARISGDDALLARLLEAWGLIEERAWDRTHGGYFQRCQQDWSVEVEAKTISIQLDSFKPAHTLYAVTGETRFLERARGLADLVAGPMRHPRSGAVLEVFTRDLTYDPLATHDQLMFGHNLKAVRLLVEAHRLTGEHRYLDAARAVLRFAIAHGWDRRFGGFYQYAYRSGRLATSTKWWWSECEGLGALLTMHTVDGNPEYLALAERLMEFCFTHFADPEAGEWYTTCAADGTPLDDRKGWLFKAAYHTVDACLAVIESPALRSATASFSE